MIKQNPIAASKLRTLIATLTLFSAEEITIEPSTKGDQKASSSDTIAMSFINKAWRAAVGILHQADHPHGDHGVTENAIEQADSTHRDNNRQQQTQKIHFSDCRTDTMLPRSCRLLNSRLPPQDNS